MRLFPRVNQIYIFSRLKWNLPFNNAWRNVSSYLLRNVVHSTSRKSLRLVIFYISMELILYVHMLNLELIYMICTALLVCYLLPYRISNIVPPPPQYIIFQLIRIVLLVRTMLYSPVIFILVKEESQLRSTRLYHSILVSKSVLVIPRKLFIYSLYHLTVFNYRNLYIQMCWC